jgi:hypothetical protein
LAGSQYWTWESQNPVVTTSTNGTAAMTPL